MNHSWLDTKLVLASLDFSPTSSVRRPAFPSHCFALKGRQLVGTHDSWWDNDSSNTDVPQANASWVCGHIFSIFTYHVKYSACLLRMNSHAFKDLYVFQPGYFQRVATLTILYIPEFEWTPGVGDGQGCLTCCDSGGRKESDTTEQLNWTELKSIICEVLNSSPALYPQPSFCFPVFNIINFYTWKV